MSPSFMTGSIFVEPTGRGCHAGMGLTWANGSLLARGLLVDPLAQRLPRDLGINQFFASSRPEVGYTALDCFLQNQGQPIGRLSNQSFVTQHAATSFPQAFLSWMLTAICRWFSSGLPGKREGIPCLAPSPCRQCSYPTSSCSWCAGIRRSASWPWLGGVATDTPDGPRRCIS